MELVNINPWLQIWVHPKKTMRLILDTNPRRIIIWLALIGGIVSTFAWISYIWATHPNLQDLNKTYPVIILLIGGSAAGLIHLYVAGWLYRLTGSWIGGHGSFTDVKCAVGWSSYPFILANSANILSLLSFSFMWARIFFGLLDALVALWGVIIFLNVLGEAHRFSAWRALLAVIIALVLVFAFVLFISLLIPLLAPLF